MQFSPVRFLAVILLSLGIVGNAAASAPPNITAEERALWPAWCNMTNGTAGYPMMLSRYGEAWGHMHHHCYAVIDWMRLNRLTVGKDRRFASPVRALGNLDYVLQRSTPAFPFRKDTLALKVQFLDRYYDREAAIKVAQQLIDEYPIFADGYVALADLFQKENRRADARRVLEAGEEKVADKARFARMRAMVAPN